MLCHCQRFQGNESSLCRCKMGFVNERWRWDGEVGGIKELIEVPKDKSSHPLMDESHKHGVKHSIWRFWCEVHKYAEWTHTGGGKWEKGCDPGKTGTKCWKPKSQFILYTRTQFWLQTSPLIQLNNLWTLLNVGYTRFFLNTHASIFSVIWKTVSLAFSIFITIHLGYSCLDHLDILI